ncbi:MAG TPA: GNAT family N-acetyltransferase [Candidatus Sulfotelmatobacter sp.]|jgi:GNAT superfamily N-acetyltransferase|nr:GNAT family N-acetyltransferase [Candidatus Sulfotelmatobacter sp.]
MPRDKKDTLSITFRIASLDDLSIIHAIRRDAILGMASEIALSDRQQWADKRSPEYFRDRVVAGNIVIANVNGDNIGWASSFKEWITGLYVVPLWSSRGIGRMIMSKLETEIVKRGYTNAKLASSPNATGFYTKLGYAVVGLPNDEGAISMEKRLSI